MHHHQDTLHVPKIPLFNFRWIYDTITTNNMSLLNFGVHKRSASQHLDGIRVLEFLKEENVFKKLPALTHSQNLSQSKILLRITKKNFSQRIPLITLNTKSLLTSKKICTSVKNYLISPPKENHLLLKVKTHLKKKKKRKELHSLVCVDAFHG